MTDPFPPTGNQPGSEPTVPLVPSDGYQQPAVPPLDETAIDPLGNPAGDYPDFSYGNTSAAPSVDPNPLPSTSNYPQPAAQPNYTQPAVPPTSGYAPTYQTPSGTGFAEPPGPGEVYPAQPQAAQYQSYPAPAGAQTPLHDPVKYDYGYSYGYVQQPPGVMPDHPNAVVSLILGLVGLVFFPILCPIGWAIASRGRREVAANPGRWNSGGTLTAGWVISIIGTAVWGLFVLFFVGIMVLAIAGSAMS